MKMNACFIVSFIPCCHRLRLCKVEYLPTGNFTRDERARMFIARPTYEGIRITIKSTVELVEYLLKIGFPYVLTGRFIQDS